jgi:prepilin-type N-terminal cleavage/methylation domain-containing protein
MGCPHTRRADRGGFTLVELLVVILLLAILLGLAVVLGPRLAEQARAAHGAEQLQGWLLVARQQARRDQTPTGLRLLVDADGHARSLVTIQQPDPLPAQGDCRGSGGTNPVLFDPPTDFSAGAGDPDQAAVRPGDYLELNGGGQVHQIRAVRGRTALDLSVPATLPGTPTWRILRQPRPVFGEPVLLLPVDVAVDLNPGRSQGVPVRTVPPGAEFQEILFSPSGAVIGKGTVGDKIFLWVRDVSRDNPYEGEPTVLAIGARTGFISAHPVNPTGDPFLFARDDRSSGL